MFLQCKNARLPSRRSSRIGCALCLHPVCQQAGFGMGTKGRGGRPKLANKRDHQITVRLTQAQYHRLQTAAAGGSVAALVRNQLLGRSSEMTVQVPLLNRNAWIELSRTASNLNQMSYHLNTGARPEMARILPLLRQLQRDLEEVRAGLIGGDRGNR